MVDLVRKRGFFAAGSFQAKNWAGRSQKLGTEVQWSQRGLLFDANITDPWITGVPASPVTRPRRTGCRRHRFRTSYTVNGFRRQTISRIFEGGDKDVELPNGVDAQRLVVRHRPRIYRDTGIIFSCNLINNP